MNKKTIQPTEISDITVDEIIDNGAEINHELIDDDNRELTDDEKRELIIQSIKNAKNSCKPKKHYGILYKKERQRKNRQAKSSRKANRR